MRTHHTDMTPVTSSMAPVKFSEPDIGDAEESAVARVLRSGWITTGEEAAAFEAELSHYLGGPHVATVSSCTVALEAALASLRLPPGSVVAVPTWTFVATGLVPARLNLRPALLDVEPSTLNLSPEALSSLIEADGPPGAVIPVHFAGVPIADDIYELCARHGIPIVGDAAHAFGTVDSIGPIAGRRSRADCFSFYATKNLTCAEGGAIATFDSELFEFVSQYRLHGLDRDAWKRYQVATSEQYALRFPGTKGNLPDVLAAIGRVQLSRFDEMQARRSELMNTYLAELSGVQGASPLPSMGATGSAHHLFIIVLSAGVDRQLVRTRLAAMHIGTSVHFQPLHEHDWFAQHALLRRTGLPVASDLSQRTMSLPLHPRMTREDVVHVCNALRIALAEQRR
jgi:dTDP-4-amino-4,6-dideoxygalactose transaminase